MDYNEPVIQLTEEELVERKKRREGAFVVLLMFLFFLYKKYYKILEQYQAKMWDLFAENQEGALYDAKIASLQAGNTAAI